MMHNRGTFPNYERSVRLTEWWEIKYALPFIFESVTAPF